ncbi:hypothetical protein ACFQ0T_30580 [Kitasatospora gansuensis]
MNRSPGWALLRTQLATTRTALVRVLVWSAAEALPSLLSGLLIAAATDRGFLACPPSASPGWPPSRPPSGSARTRPGPPSRTWRRWWSHCGTPWSAGWCAVPWAGPSRPATAPPRWPG